MEKSLFIILFSAVVLLSGVSGVSSLVSAKEGQIVREPAAAGRFYDANPDILRDMVNTLLKSCGTNTVSNIKPIAMISPHAGYMYSGLVAAKGFNEIKQFDYNKVIILAPSHSKKFRGVSIPAFTHYKTPLGLVEVDRTICDKLLKTPANLEKGEFWPFGTMPSAHTKEHSEETQLPFLQVALKDFKIVPMLIGNLKREDYETIAKVIKPLLDKQTLIVVSSDFMHYGNAYDYVPFTSNIEENIKKYDYAAFERITALEFDKYLDYKGQTGTTICGSNPIAVLLKILPRTTKGSLVAYDTSGHQSDDFTYSVSYASLIFTISEKRDDKYDIDKQVTDKQPSNDKDTKSEEHGWHLTDQEKIKLLDISRKTLENTVKSNVPPSFSKDVVEFSPKFTEMAGVFVTLKIKHNLRGCTGSIIPYQSMRESVVHNTINSALHDSRFMPVEGPELDDIEIEISVLSKIEKIDSYEDFENGRQGIIIKKGSASSVFLPQVANEQNWTRSETLSHLCRKAGLPQDAWESSGMEFSVFTAEVFNESELIKK